jgi:hypothetical protein
MTQAMAYPVRFTFAFHQHMLLCPVPRSHQVSAPRTAATDPDMTIDRGISKKRLL